MIIRVLTRGRSGKGPSGETVTATDGIIGKMVNVYDSKYHEAPLAIGKPKHNSPAYGWVKNLYKMGDGLYAKLHGLHDGFEAGLRSGVHEVQNTSFYPDYTLRGVSFSGPEYEIIGLPGIFGDSGPIYCFDCLKEASHQGGEAQMIDNDDPRVKAFLELGNKIFFSGKKGKWWEEEKEAPKTAGGKLNEIAKEILNNPPKHDEHGRMYWGEFNYTRAFEVACQRNPDLADAYFSEIEETRYRATHETHLMSMGGGKKK